MSLLTQGLLLMEELHWLVRVGFLERGMLVALLLDSAISLVDNASCWFRLEYCTETKPTNKQK